jgi:hypothetical protein
MAPTINEDLILVESIDERMSLFGMLRCKSKG